MLWTNEKHLLLGPFLMGLFSQGIFKMENGPFITHSLRGSFRTPPAWHRGLPGPSGPKPQKSPKRVRKGVPGPPAPGSPRVPKECAPESEKSPKRVRSRVFGLFSDSGENIDRSFVRKVPVGSYQKFVRDNAAKSRRPFRISTSNECYTSQRQSRDSNRNATNARSMRTDFSVLGGDMFGRS